MIEDIRKERDEKYLKYKKIRKVWNTENGF